MVCGLSAGGRRIRTFRPSQDQCLSELVEPCAERRSLDKSSLGRDRGRTAGFAPKAPFADRLRRELHSQTTSRDRSNTWTMPNSTGCSRPLLSYGPTELSWMRDRWFESVSLQQTVWSLAGIRLSPSRSRALPPVLRAGAASAVGRDGHDAAIWRQRAIISLSGPIPVPQRQ